MEKRERELRAWAEDLAAANHGTLLGVQRKSSGHYQLLFATAHDRRFRYPIGYSPGDSQRGLLNARTAINRLFREKETST